MRFAVISDIHGNRLALEAVIDDIAAQGVEAVLNLGDHFSGPLDPKGVGDILVDFDGPAIAGNHDRWLKEKPVAELGPIDRMVIDRLTPRHRAWLADLPPTRVFENDVFMCHGTPTSDTSVWLDAYWQDRRTTLPTEDAVAAEAEGLDYPMMLCGHTHWSRSVKLCDGRMVVNPGSVGLQFIHGSPDARYAIIERRDGKWSVTFRVVGYDHEAAALQAEANGFGFWRETLVGGWAAPDTLF
jgi:predicted phosphodiesterase